MSAALLRLQPLIEGVRTASEFLEDIVEDTLIDMCQRLTDQEHIQPAVLDKHKQAVINKMSIRVAPKETGVQQRTTCQGITNSRKRCKCKALPASEFCARHSNQRPEFQEAKAVKQQLREHYWKVNALKSTDHTHIFTGDFVPTCAACCRGLTLSEAATYSAGSSLNQKRKADAVEQEATSRPAAA